MKLSIEIELRDHIGNFDFTDRAGVFNICKKEGIENLQETRH